jgi:hypothetical protein
MKVAPSPKSDATLGANRIALPMEFDAGPDGRGLATDFDREDYSNGLNGAGVGVGRDSFKLAANLAEFERLNGGKDAPGGGNNMSPSRGDRAGKDRFGWGNSGSPSSAGNDKSPEKGSEKKSKKDKDKDKPLGLDGMAIQRSVPMHAGELESQKFRRKVPDSITGADKGRRKKQEEEELARQQWLNEHRLANQKLYFEAERKADDSAKSAAEKEAERKRARREEREKDRRRGGGGKMIRCC